MQCLFKICLCSPLQSLAFSFLFLFYNCRNVWLACEFIVFFFLLAENPSILSHVPPLFLRLTSGWQRWGDEARVAERQRPFSQTHDHPGSSLPLCTRGGEDGHPAESVQGGEDAGSVPDQTQAAAPQESWWDGQPQTLHRLHHRRECRSPPARLEKQSEVSENSWNIWRNNAVIDFSALSVCGVGITGGRIIVQHVRCLKVLQWFSVMEPYCLILKRDRETLLQRSEKSTQNLKPASKAHIFKVERI